MLDLKKEHREECVKKVTSMVHALGFKVQCEYIYQLLSFFLNFRLLLMSVKI